jgi:hypothetical protein
MLATGAALTLFGPPLAMMAAALMTARDASQEDFRMLLVTGIDPRQIVSGYVRGSVYRLRLLWAAGAGIVPGAWIALAAGIVKGLPGGPGACSPPYCLPIGGGWPLGLLLGLLGIGFWLLLAYMLFHVAVMAGVWAGLRWPQEAVMRAGGIVLVYFMLPILARAADGAGTWNRDRCATAAVLAGGDAVCQRDADNGYASQRNAVEAKGRAVSFSTNRREVDAQCRLALRPIRLRNQIAVAGFFGRPERPCWPTCCMRSSCWSFRWRLLRWAA